MPAEMFFELTVYVLLLGARHFMAGRFAHYLVGSGARYLVLERRSLVYHLRHPFHCPKPPLKLITPQTVMSTTACESMRSSVFDTLLDYYKLDCTRSMTSSGERDRGFPLGGNPRVAETS